ncbi:MAG: hypothetical protein AAF495_25635 [Pseudomonadota bacterium]
MKDADALLSDQRGAEVDFEPSGTSSQAGASRHGIRGLVALAILFGTSLAGYALIFTVLRNITS